MRRWITVGLEESFGGSVGAPAYWLDCLSASLDVPNNPFIEIPSVRTRSVQSLKRGVYIPTGDLEMVLDRYKMGHFFRSMLGNYLSLGSTKIGAAVTLDGDVSAGDSEVTLSDVSAFATDGLLQFGDDWAATAEVHRISQVDTANKVVTLGENLLNNHSDGIDVQAVSAPFGHQFSPTLLGGTLPSLEIRVVKDAIGGDHRFLGATIDAATFNLEVNDVMKVTLGVIAQKDQMVGHSGPPSSGLAMAGFGFDEIEHFRFDPDGAESAVDLTAFTRSMAISYSNGIQADQGVRFGSRFPRELPVGAAEAMVRATLVFKDIKAHQWFWGQASGPGETSEPNRGNIQVQVQRDGGDQESYIFDLYRAYPRSVTTRLVGPDVLVEDVEFFATSGDSGEPFVLTHWNSSVHLYGAS